MLTTNTEFLYPELMDVVRLFGESAPDAAHNFIFANDHFINTVLIGGREYAFREEWKCSNELEFKRYAKRFAKLAVYEALRAETGRSMPWGALTGIRPTKLAYAEAEAGRDFAVLFEKFGVSAENIALVKAVLENQRGIYGKEEGAADLYVGIPFCPSKCDYCSFITADIARTRRYIGDYLSALEREIGGCRGLYRRLKSVYVGGGTPLVLSVSDLRRVLEAIAPLSEGAEYTVEAGRPDVFTEEKLALLKEYGVTRICINPQTFSDATLERIGRRHTAADIYRAFEMARPFGFDINCDLIAGLPTDTPEGFAVTLTRVLALAPENITVHTLSMKRGSTLTVSGGALPAAEDVGNMLSGALDRLPAAGYEPYYLYRQKYMAGGYENVGWTRPGHESPYNICIMEELCSIISMGAGGSTKLVAPGRIKRFFAPKYPLEYINGADAVRAGKERITDFYGL